LIASCGGGGGSGGTPVVTGFAGLPAAATLAQSCAVPRHGVDAYTGQAYTDRQGSLLDEQNWLAAWTNDLYLWYSEVPYPAPANYSDTASYFKALKTPNLSPSGASKDKFHFTYATSVWEALSGSGVQAGYGVTWSLLSPSVPRSVVVAYTDPNTPATQPTIALARGTQVLWVDGVDLVNDNTHAGVTVINAGLFPSNVGESHTFVVQDLGATAARSVTMVTGSVTSTPVQGVGTLAGGQVGYMLFNDHMATAEAQLIAAVNQLKAASVSDLVIDIRYNGGGYLTIASELAYMVAGPARTAGKTFELLTFNDKHKSFDPVTGAAIAPVPFQTTAVGFSASSGTACRIWGWPGFMS
jgi:hypothetical protein